MKTIITAISALLIMSAGAATGEKSMKIEKIRTGIIEHPTYHGWPTVIRTRENKILRIIMKGEVIL